MRPFSARILDASLYALSLSLLHSTLTLLTYHQYALTTPYATIFSSLFFPIFPLFFLLNLLLVRPHAHRLVTQLLFCVIGVGAGCYMVALTREGGYLAVMRRAPMVGTGWVWAVVEMRGELAVGSLVVTAGWAWWVGDA